VEDPRNADGTGQESPRLGRSYSRTCADGKVRNFPNRQDFEELYEDLGSRIDECPEILPDVILDWVRRGQTGCRFAQILAHKADAAGWHSATFLKRLDPGSIGELVGLFLSGTAGHAEAVQLIFPYIKTPEELAQLVNDLCASDSWYWEEGEESDLDGIPVSLRWRLPLKRAVSWVLGFAPFDFMPVTRRAPFVALQMRVGEQKRTPEQFLDDGTSVVHLADLDDMLGNREVARQRLNDETRAAKSNILNGELVSAARARITFIIPADLRHHLMHAE
jgi:hypothetical protein